jgi:hypothetical protein
MAASWSDAFTASLGGGEILQIADGAVLAVVKNLGPGNVQLGTAGPVLKPGQFAMSRQNGLTLHCFGQSNVSVQFAAV